MIAIVIKAKIMRENNARMIRTLLKYLLAWVLSLATSLISRALYPKSEKMAKIAVKARAKEYLPKITSPKLRAMKMDNTSDSIEQRIERRIMLRHS